MTRIGKYVSGSATAENTSEYSVILIGSMVLNPSTAPASRLRITNRWKRDASFGRTNLPHCQPKYCATVYPDDSAVSSDAPNVAATNPTMTNARPTLPSAIAMGSATCDKWLTSMPYGNSTSA